MFLDPLTNPEDGVSIFREDVDVGLSELHDGICREMELFIITALRTVTASHAMSHSK